MFELRRKSVYIITSKMLDQKHRYFLLRFMNDNFDLKYRLKFKYNNLSYSKICQTINEQLIEQLNNAR